MSSTAFVRGLQGPIGSGKSVGCVIECLRLMLGQERSIDLQTGERTGKRKVRVGVIRNTTPQLETTTMKTWLEWLPESDFGPMRWRAPFRQTINIPEYDLECEVWFLALDRDEDVRKLLSFEFTFIWLNEARELSREIITAAISRVKRYPRIIEGGPTRSCVIMDTNTPHEEHWWAIMSGQAEPPDWMSEEDRLTLIKPDNWEFFTQPPAVLDQFGPAGELVGYELNPARENAKFTDKTYYTELLHGQTRDWIRNMLQNRIGRLFSGRPVYQGFNENMHVSDRELKPVEGHEIHVGVDFGLTPAACFGQDIRGQVRVIDEIVTRDTNAVQFAQMLVQHITEFYPNFRFVFTGDPRGDDRATTDSQTPFQIFKAAGIDIQPAWTNEPQIRIGAVETQLNTLIEGRPAYVVSPRCTYIINAKKGGYCYLKDREEIDKKSIYSHVSDGEQYMMQRMGFAHPDVLSSYQQLEEAVFSRQGSELEQMFALYGLFAHRMISGRVRACNEMVDQMEMIAKDQKNPVLSILWRVNDAATGLYSGDFDRMLNAGSEVKKLYDAEQHGSIFLDVGADPMIAILSAEAHVYAHRGNLELVRKRVEECVVHVDRIGADLQRPWVHIFAPAMLFFFNEEEESLNKLQQGFELADKLGAAFWSLVGRIWHSSLLCFSGEYETGIAGLNAMLPQAEAVGAQVNVPLFRAALAYANLKTGNTEAAEADSRWATRRVAYLGEGEWAPLIWQVRSLVLSGRGQNELADYAVGVADCYAKRSGATIWSDHKILTR